MFPAHAGARKEYGNGNIGTCCGGTGLESPMKYLETAYARNAAGDELFVNLYAGSTLTWADKGLKLVQTTEYPRDGEINFTFSEARSEEHTSELQSRGHLVCRLLLEKKNIKQLLSRCPRVQENIF